MTDHDIREQLANGASYFDLEKQGVGWRRVKRIKKGMAAGELPPAKVNGAQSKSDKPGITITERENNVEIISVSDNIKTVEEALAKAQIDLKLWRITETSINSWEVGGKLHHGQDSAGHWKPQSLWKNSLWQVKVKLSRRAPKPIQDGIKDLLAELKPQKWKPLIRPLRPNMLVELSLYDAHFGKLAWAKETGEANYDLKIAEFDYANAVADLLAHVKSYSIEKVVLPIGHDFWHVDNWMGTTAKGTAVDSSDDRFQKVFRVGCRAVQHAIEACREVADVECLWIPGNHDPSTSWYLCEFLSAWFRGDKHVTFDNSAVTRKYRRFGNTLLGYCHGDTPGLAKLPLLMAKEAKDDWGAALYHAWRTGHLHKRKSVDFNVGDTFNGVRVDVLPSLSATDKWHYDQGFVRNTRTAEVWLWDREEGYTGHFSVNAKSNTHEVPSN